MTEDEIETKQSNTDASQLAKARLVLDDVDHVRMNWMNVVLHFVMLNIVNESVNLLTIWQPAIIGVFLAVTSATL